MGLPKKLKNFNVFDSGASYMGQVSEVQLPKLSRKMEAWRGAGMSGEVETDQGMEVMTMEHTYGGIMRSILEQWGVLKHDGVQLRFSGAYRAEDSDKYDTVEVTVRGRHKEIDMGTAKMAGETAFKVNTTLSYYKLVINGEDVLEIDVLAGVEKVKGVDRLADERKAIGL
jgi:P2 family phage contractile tail tube protein